MGSVRGGGGSLVHSPGGLVKPIRRRENPVVQSLELARHLVEGASQNADFILLV